MLTVEKQTSNQSNNSLFKVKKASQRGPKPAKDSFTNNEASQDPPTGSNNTFNNTQKPYKTIMIKKMIN